MNSRNDKRSIVDSALLFLNSRTFALIYVVAMIIAYFTTDNF